MQKKTVRKIIKSKMDSWLASITDENLRKDVEKHLLVSGGCVTSLLLNEKVNDYDVYIQDRNTLLRLVQYYVNPENYIMDNAHSGLDDDKDAVRAIEILDEHKKEELFNRYKTKLVEGDPTKVTIQNKYTIAVTNMKPDQIKLFFTQDSQYGGYKVPLRERAMQRHTSNVAGLSREEIVEQEPDTNIHLLPIPIEKQIPDRLISYPKYTPVFFSANAISLTDELQIVIRFFGSPEEIHKNFDFIHATNYYTTKDGVVTNLEAVESILAKQLKYQGSLYPLTSVIRTKKFIKRGWNISASTYLKILFQVSELDLKNINVLEEQLASVDVAYFSHLISILRDVDPEKISASYIGTLIDRLEEGWDDSNSTITEYE